MRLASLTIFSKLYLGSEVPSLNFPQNFLLSRSHQVITLDYLYIYSSFLFADMLLQFINEPCRQGFRHRGNRGNASPIFSLSNICRKLIVHFNVEQLKNSRKSYLLENWALAKCLCRQIGVVPFTNKYL